MIEKLTMRNFKHFENETIVFNKGRNVIVGENGVGKSTVLQAIRYVLSGSSSRIERVGLSSLFNINAIEKFMKGSKKQADLPVMEVELYIDNELNNFEINGKFNTEKRLCNGIKMIAEPNDNYSPDIKKVLENSNVFPFEYYKLDFRTFNDTSYSSMRRYKNYIRYSFLDSSSVNSEYAMQEYVKKIYKSQTDTQKRKAINSAYRDDINDFSKRLYEDFEMETSEDGYSILLNSENESVFEDSITAQKDGVFIQGLGQGERIFINTDFSLSKADEDISVVLIEEPENHLSHLNMHKLIDKISEENEKQTFIATHSNMIASRLNLRNVIFLNDNGNVKLEDLPNEVAKFFEKAPDNNVLSFILSKKVILVEGSAEYILISEFFKQLTTCDMYNCDIAVISVGGKTFKNYLELSKCLNKKIAVITDNDHDYKKNIKDSYALYEEPFVRIFADEDNERHTFEVSMYKNNEQFYKDNLENSQMSLGIQSYMLSNKAEAALRLLTLFEKEPEKTNEFNIPQYIKDAIKWISE